MKKIFISLSVFLFFIASSISIAEDKVGELISKGVNSSLNAAGELVTSLIPGDGDTEVTLSKQDNYDLRYSILAVRPIAYNPYSALPNKHLYFTQLRLGNHEPYANGDQRVLFNAGLGFRTLVNNNNAILGLNAFYDHEFEQDHQRGSVGVEYLASNCELFANIYDRLSERSTYIHGSSTITEEVLDGFDYSIVGQIPYMPWAKAVYKGYNWNQTGSDLEGYNIGLEAQLFRGLVLEFGRNNGDNQSSEDFYKLTFRWPSNHLTPTLITHTVTDYAFPEKNMENEMLHKVRRTNNIITEKKMGGIVVVRGT